MEATLPIFYVRLKRNKNFAVARPIASYHNFVSARLFRAASTLLNILLPVVYPSSLGPQSLSQVFRDLHSFVHAAPLEVHLEQHNQDLVGFFASVPIEEIMESVKDLVDQHVAKQAEDLEKTAFTVQLDATERKLRGHKDQKIDKDQKIKTRTNKQMKKDQKIVIPNLQP